MPEKQEECSPGRSLCQTGLCGNGKQVAAGMVSKAFAAVGQEIAMARRENPFKVEGSKDFIHPLKTMIKGFAEEDPPTEKKLPVDVDVVETCCKWGNRPGATAKERIIGNLILIKIYI